MSDVRAFGTKVFEKTSWGKKQIKTHFDLDIIKSNISSNDLAVELYNKMMEDVGFQVAKGIIDKIVYYAMCIDSTYGYNGYIAMLKSVWEEKVLPDEFNMADGEFLYLKRFFNKMKAECPEGTVIGKNQVRHACFKHAIDLLDYV